MAVSGVISNMWLFLPRTNWGHDPIWRYNIFELAASTTNYMVNGEIVGSKVFNLPTGSALFCFCAVPGCLCWTTEWRSFWKWRKGLRQCPTHFYVFFSKKNYGKVGIQSQPCWIYRRVGWTSTPISGIKTRDWMIESRFSSEDPTTNSLISHSFPDMSGMANNLLMVHEDDLVPSWAEFHQELFQELVPRQQHWHLNFCCIQILSKYRYIDIISFHMTHDERRNAKKVPFVKTPSRRIWFSKMHVQE